MEIVVADNKRRKAFLQFYKKQYIDKPLKRDNLSSMVKSLLNGKSELCKSVDIEPLMVMDNDKIVMVCILAHARRMMDYVQISFFECEDYNMEAFKMILKKAEFWAKEKKASKICSSLNIHVNYGLGFLSSGYDMQQSFGMPHNPEFYHLYFKQNGFAEIPMVSYKKNMTEMHELFNNETRKKMENKYTIKEADFKNLKSEISKYTKVNNEAFKDHLFYYPRKVEEDMELFKDLRYLLKPENLIFVEKNKKAVGFMLWYPDFNQLISPSETAGIKTVVKNKLFHNKINTFKIVEMGVIPEERDKGAILALFNHCFKCTKGKYEFFESGWILEDNIKSKNFGIKWADSESKHYKAYIKDLKNDI